MSEGCPVAFSSGPCTVWSKDYLVHNTVSQHSDSQVCGNVNGTIDTCSMVTGPSLGSLAVTYSLLEGEHNREADLWDAASVN